MRRPGWAAWRHPQLARSVSEINDIPADDIRLRAFMKSRLQSPRMMNITGGSEIPLEFLNFDNDFGSPTTLHKGQCLAMHIYHQRQRLPPIAHSALYPLHYRPTSMLILILLLVEFSSGNTGLHTLAFENQLLLSPY